MAMYFLNAEQLVMELGKDVNRRGLNVYHVSELMGVSARTKQGEQISTTIERPLFGLAPEQRVDMMRATSDVFGIVTSRMNRISGLDWTVKPKTQEEDRLEQALKTYKQIYSEYDAPDIKHAVVRAQMARAVKEELRDILPDLSNFKTSLMRWKRRNKLFGEQDSTQIEDWLKEPNIQDNFDDFLKKYVQDLMVHGAATVYKEKDVEDGTLDNFYLLPGGTTIPVRNQFAGGVNAYVQLVPGMQPLLYYQDEISYSSYVPSTASSYGLIPLEALVNKVAESLLFDRLAAERADGTKPPEKIVIFGDKSPFGDIGMEDNDVPLPPEEQKRLEQMLNEPRQYAIRTLSGIGTPIVMDLSKADTFAAQTARQDKIRQAIAIVYNMSNMEINLSGSEETSGRATSESQERIEREKGIWPIVKEITNRLNNDIIPLRFGPGFVFEFSPGMTEEEKIRIDRDKMLTGTYAANEVREDRGDDPYPDEQFDLPQGAQQPVPTGTQEQPLFVEQSR